MADIETASAQRAVSVDHNLFVDSLFSTLFIIFGFDELEHMVFKACVQTGAAVVALVHVPLHFGQADPSQQVVGGADGANIFAPCASGEEDLKEQYDNHPDCRQTPSVSDHAAHDTDGVDHFKYQIAVDRGGCEKGCPEEEADIGGEFTLFDDLFAHELHVEIFTDFTEESVGADPCAVGFAADQKVEGDQCRAADDDVGVYLMVGREDLHRGKGVDQMKAQQSRTVERPLQKLDIDMKGEEKEQIDQDDTQPAPCTDGRSDFSLSGFVVKGRPERRVDQLSYTCVVSVHLPLLVGNLTLIVSLRPVFSGTWRSRSRDHQAVDRSCCPAIRT